MNKKIIFGGFLLVLLIITAVIVLTINNNDEEELPQEYSGIEIIFNEGSWGEDTVYNTETITVKLSYDKSSISYKDKISKDISINKNEFKELVDLIDNNFYELEEDLSNNGVLDGDISSITVKDNNKGKNYTSGGYAVENETYNEIRSKIKEVIGKDTISTFRNDELKRFLDVT